MEKIRQAIDTRLAGQHLPETVYDAPGLPAGAACAGLRPCWRLYACWAAQQRWQRPDCSA